MRFPCFVDVNDMYQYGVIGLLGAAKSFDPARGFKFSTYASPRIRGAILDGIRTDDYLTRIQRHQNPFHANKKMHDGILDPDNRGVRQVDARDFLMHARKFLPPQERQVIDQFYGEGKTAKQIAVAMDRPVAQVGVAKHHALKTLRRIFNPKGVES